MQRRLGLLGTHIAVWGQSASGKTTFAASLAARLGVPHVEMDALWWKPDWVESDIEEFRAAISAALAAHPHGWVMDGNYSRVQDLVLPRADTVVWLRMPLWRVLGQVLRRTFYRCRTGDPLWGINRETWRLAFFSRQSLIWYILRTWCGFPGKRREILATVPHRATVIVLRSRKDVRRFFRDLDRPAG